MSLEYLFFSLFLCFVFALKFEETTALVTLFQY
jgi:hypothetical protein